MIWQLCFMVLTQRNGKLMSTQSTWMFLVALFIIAKTWKQPRYPSVVGEWIHKLWYIQTMKYYSILNRNKLSNKS